MNHERDFVDIRDIANAIKLLFLLKKRGIYNIGSGKKIPLIKLINFFSRRLKKNFTINNFKSKKTTLVANNSKLTKLGWKPKFGIFSTLSKYYQDKNFNKS